MNMVDGGINNLWLALLKYEDSGARHAAVSWENETKKGPVFEIFQFSKKNRCYNTGDSSRSAPFL